MLTGYNTDIKHQGIVYHVQTEDGGEDNPVIVSLVYQGGRILASRKTSYAKLLGTDDLISQLRELLEERLIGERQPALTLSATQLGYRCSIRFGDQLLTFEAFEASEAYAAGLLHVLRSRSAN